MDCTVFTLRFPQLIGKLLLYTSSSFNCITLDLWQQYIMSRPALGPAQPPIQWTQRVLSPWLDRLGHEGYTYHLVPRLRMRGAISPFLHMSSWQVQGQL